MISRRGFLAAPAAAIAARALGETGGTPGRKKDGRDGEWKPRLSENLADVQPATLRWLAQLGCRHVIFQGTDSVDPDRKGYWTTDDVMRVKKSCDDAGMVLESMMIPIDFYKKARHGQQGRREQAH